MITVLKENVFFENLHIGDSVRPNVFTFIIVCNGTIDIELNQKKSTHQKGNIIALSPDVVYKIEHFSSDLKAFIISFDRDKVRKKINFNYSKYDVYRVASAEKSGNLLFFEDLEFKNVTSLAEQLHYYLNFENEIKFAEEIITALFTTLIYIVTGKLVGSFTLNKSDNRKEDITMSFLELVALHYKNNRELKFYADELLISIKYLSNCVRETTNVPPTKFLADALINEAKALLLNSKDTISMIASDLNFSDQYSFGKFFKKHTGYSPKNFKKQNSLNKHF